MSVAERSDLVAEACELAAKNLRGVMHVDDTAAFDKAARAYVRALDGPPRPTAIVSFADLLMTREFHDAFQQYLRARGLRFCP